MSTLSDESQVKILNGEYRLVREQILKKLYEDKDLFSSVKVFVTASGGDAADAKDVYQDAIIILDRNLGNGKFKGESTIRTYFTAIAKWRWVAMRRSKGRSTVEIEQHLSSVGVDDPEIKYLEEERRNVLNQVIDKLGDRCQKMLTMYKQSYSNEEIAAAMGFANADVAKNEVYKCRQKLKEYLQKLPEV